MSRVALALTGLLVSWVGRWVPLVGFVLAVAAAGVVGWVLVSSRRS